MRKLKSLITLSIFALYTLGATTVFAGEDVKINKSNFPDNVFRAMVKDEFDTDENGKLSDEEISKVRKIVLDKQDLYFFEDSKNEEYVTLNCKGLEYFINLENLKI